MPTPRASSSSFPRRAPFPCGTSRAHGLPGHCCFRPLGRAAGLVGGGIAAAFFTSLEQCSCVEVRTEEDDDVEAEAAPLLHRGGSPPTPTAARRAGKKRRGLLGCCENDAIN